MNSRIYLLIKIFDKEEFADAFIKNGEMYCRTIGDFKNIEDDNSRGDQYEAVTSHYQPDQISANFSYMDEEGVEQSFTINQNDLAGPITTQYNGYNKLNIYCMYSIKILEFEESYETEYEKISITEKINSMLQKQLVLDEKILLLGQYAVIVYKVEEFITKVRDSARSRNFSYWSSSIEYYDSDKFNGNFKEIETIFRKRNIYDYQNEYRFAFDSKEPEGHKIISVGPLEGVAFKILTKDINKRLKLEIKK